VSYSGPTTACGRYDASSRAVSSSPRVHADTVAGLEELLDQFLIHGQTVSSIVVTSPVDARALPVLDPD
jgi:hypothetical protein